MALSNGSKRFYRIPPCRGDAVVKIFRLSVIRRGEIQEVHHGGTANVSEQVPGIPATGIALPPAPAFSNA